MTTCIKFLKSRKHKSATLRPQTAGCQYRRNWLKYTNNLLKTLLINNKRIIAFGMKMLL